MSSKYQIPDIWENRWGILTKQMTNMSSGFEAAHEAGHPRMETLGSVVKSLMVFAQGQLDYFAAQFANGQKRREYPDNYVFSTILDQVGFDLQVIQQAANQRIKGSPAIQKALSYADKIAFAALSPVELTQNTTIVTYIGKSVSIRVIPYANVAFIGIPFTCIPEPETLEINKFGAQDYLAIPHEVGHFLYWRGQFIKGEYIHQTYRKNFGGQDSETDPFYHWAEEIFCDVYGCLIAGAVIALDFQDLQLRTSQEDFITDDSAHPPPIIRPDIYTSVLLRSEKQEVRDLASALNAEWVKKRQTIDIKQGDKYQEQVIIGKNKNPIPIANLVDTMEIMGFTYEQLSPHIYDTTIEWWDEYPEATGAGADSLYEAFAMKFSDGSIEKLDSPHEMNIVVDEAFVKKLHAEWEAIGSDPAWLSVLAAGGWATKGPMCEGGNGVC